MERIGVRELRNEVSRVVRRASSGERIIITVDGVPAAEIGPLNARTLDRTIEDLISAGLLAPPRARTAARQARPVRVPGGRTTTEILRDDRDR